MEDEERPPTQWGDLAGRTGREKGPLIAIVGPCASGKSTLVQALRERGYNAREVVQEHSYVPTMWQRITQPDLLVYLDVSWETARQRRPTDAGPDWWEKLARRLRHARQHADIYILTDELSPQEVLDRTLTLLE
jgi:thymidylate kinase